MKVRESGMPNEDYWNSFFDVDLILEKLQINSKIESIVEVGCGYGTFTIPVSKVINGKLFAFDVDNEMIVSTRKKIELKNIKNVELIERDILKNTTGLANNSVDYVMLFNILHHEKPEEILDETYRILKQGGKLGIIHWRTDIETPRGPSMEIRTKPEDCVKWVLKSKFQLVFEPQNIEPYHFGLLTIK